MNPPQSTMFSFSSLMVGAQEESAADVPQEWSFPKTLEHGKLMNNVGATPVFAL